MTEWFLPANVSQSGGGVRPSLARPLIAVELTSWLLTDKRAVADGKPTSIIPACTITIRQGNKRYKSSSVTGLLGIYQALALCPDLNLEIEPNLDLGFFNRQHLAQQLPKVMRKMAFGEALFMQTRILCVSPSTTIFDSYDHGNHGALLAVGKKNISPELATIYIGLYMERHFSLRSQASCN